MSTISLSVKRQQYNTHARLLESLVVIATNQPTEYENCGRGTEQKSSVASLVVI